MDSPFIAVDWGTPNRRAYRIDARGSVQKVYRDHAGVGSIRGGGFERAIALKAQRAVLPLEVPYLIVGDITAHSLVCWRPQARAAAEPAVPSTNQKTRLSTLRRLRKRSSQR
jgi:2-keto-3-deoxy-galactonokinase